MFKKPIIVISFGLVIFFVVLSLYSISQYRSEPTPGCERLNFHWNCCETSPEEILEIPSDRLQNMLIMDWSSFPLEQEPPLEAFMKFYVNVNKELKERGDQPIFSPADFKTFSNINQRSKR